MASLPGIHHWPRPDKMSFCDDREGMLPWEGGQEHEN